MLLDDLGIVESTEPGAFPSPRQYTQFYLDQGADRDISDIGDEYAKQWAKQQKALRTPDWQITQGQNLIKESLFGRAISAQDFITNYERYLDPNSAPPTIPGQEQQAAQAGISGGLVEGAGAAAGGTLKGIFQDLPNALAAQAGEIVVTGQENDTDSVNPVFQAGQALTAFVRGVVGGDTTPVPLGGGQQVQYLPPETISTFLKYGGENILYGDSGAVQAGQNIIDATAAENPGGFGFDTARTVGGAGVTLLTGLGGAAAKLSVTGSAALATIQSAGQLANEQAQDYIRVINRQGAEDGRAPGEITYDADDLSKATLLAAGMSALDTVNIGSLLKLTKISNLRGLDDALKGRLGDALTSQAPRNPTLRRMARAAGIGAVNEASAEVLQQLGSNWIANGLIEYDPDRNIFTGTAEAAEGGAIAGAVLNGVLGAFIGGRRTPPAEAQDGESAPRPATGPGSSFQSDIAAPLESDGSELLRGEADDKAFREAATSIVESVRRGSPEAQAREPGISQALRDNTQQLAVAEKAEQEAAQLQQVISERTAAGATPSALVTDNKRLRTLQKQARPAQSLRDERDRLQQAAAPIQSAIGSSAVNPWAEEMAAVERKHGLPQGSAAIIAGIESDFKPGAKNPNSSATGLYQFTTATGKDYKLIGKGKDLRKDPLASIRAFGELAEDNARYLRGIGVPVTPFTLYMTHQQGRRGFGELIRAIQTGNVDADMRNRLDLNGGKGLTPQQFLNKWQSIFERKTQSRQQLGDVRQLPRVPENAETDDSPFTPSPYRQRFLLDQSSLVAPDSLRQQGGPAAAFRFQRFPFAFGSRSQTNNPDQNFTPDSGNPRFIMQGIIPSPFNPTPAFSTTQSPDTSVGALAPDAVQTPPRREAPPGPLDQQEQDTGTTQIGTLENTVVRYGGDVGVLQRTPQGYQLVGQQATVPIESGESGRSAEALGITPVTAEGTVVGSPEQTAAQQQVFSADWRVGRITVRGQNYAYLDSVDANGQTVQQSNIDAEGTTTVNAGDAARPAVSVRAIRADGQVVTFRGAEANQIEESRLQSDFDTTYRTPTPIQPEQIEDTPADTGADPAVTIAVPTNLATLRVPGRVPSQKEVTRAIEKFQANVNGDYSDLTGRQVSIIQGLIDVQQNPELATQDEIDPIASQVTLIPETLPTVRKVDGTPYKSQPGRNEFERVVAKAQQDETALTARDNAILDALTEPDRIADDTAVTDTAPEQGYSVGDQVRDAEGQTAEIVGKTRYGNGVAYRLRERDRGPSKLVAESEVTNPDNYVPHKIDDRSAPDAPRTMDEILNSQAITDDAYAAIANAMGQTNPPKTIGALKHRAGKYFDEIGYPQGREEIGELEQQGVLAELIGDRPLPETDLGQRPESREQQIDQATRFGLGGGTGLPVPVRDLTTTLDRALGRGNYVLGVPPNPNWDVPAGTVVKAAFANGQIYVNPDAVSTTQEAEFYALQEKAHKGIRELFGDEYTARMGELYEQVGGDAGIARIAAANDIDMSRYFRLAEDTNLAPADRADLLTDELISHLVNQPERWTVRVNRALKKVMGAIRAGIRRSGLLSLSTVNDSDLVYLAQAALRAANNPANTWVAENMVNVTPIEQNLPRFPPRYGLGSQEQQENAQANARIVQRYNDRHLARRVFSAFDGISFTERFNGAVQNLFGGMANLRSAGPSVMQKYFTADAGLRRDVADIKTGIGRDNVAASWILQDEVVLQDQLWQQVFGVPAESLTADQRKIANNVLTGVQELNNPALQKDAMFFRRRIDAASRELVNRLRRSKRMRIEMLDEDGRAEIADLLDEYDAGLFEFGADDIPPHFNQIMVAHARMRTVEANYGNYMRQSYQAFSDPKWKSKVVDTPAFTAAVEHVKQRMIDRNDERGLPPLLPAQLQINAEASVNGMLDRATRTADPFEFMVDQNGGANQDIFRRRDPELPQAIKELLGPVDDPVLNYANSLLKIYGHVASLDFQFNMREALLATGQASVAGSLNSGEHTTALGSGSRWSEINDVLMTPELAKAINEYGEMPMLANGDVFSRTVLRASQAVKYGKTVLSPTTAMRNLASGVLLAGAVGTMAFSPQGYKTLKSIWNSKTRFAIGRGIQSDFAAKQLNEKYIRLGIRKDGGTSGELQAMLRDVVGAADQISRRGGVTQSILDMAQRFYEFGDDFYKVIAFETDKSDLMRHGMNEAEAELEAARRIRDTMPTYSRVPHAIQQLRKFPLMGTFVSFPWEIMRNVNNNRKLIIRDWNGLDSSGNRSISGPRRDMALRRMIGMAATSALPAALVYMSNELLNVDDGLEDLAEESGPSWQKGALRLYTENSADGFSFIDMTSWVPSEVYVRAIREAYRGVVRDDRTAMQGIANAAKSLSGPFVSLDISVEAALDVMFNQTTDGFPVYGRGVTIGDLVLNGSDHGQSIAQAMAHMGRTLLPGFVNNYMDYVRSRTEDISNAVTTPPPLFGESLDAAIGGRTSRTGRQYDDWTATLGMLGLRMVEKSLDQASFALARDTKNKVNNISANFGQVIDEPVPRSVDFLQAQIDAAISQRQRAYQPAMRAIRYYADVLKYPPSQIVRIMTGKHGGPGLNRVEGMSESDVKTLIANQIPTFAPKMESLMNGSMRAVQSRRDLTPPQKLQAKQNIVQKTRIVEQLIKQAVALQ